MQQTAESPSPNPGMNTPMLSPEQIQAVKTRSFHEGVKACSPTLVGIAAWGLVVGIAMIKSHFTVAQALGMTFTVFAGSAQLAALPLITAGAPVWVIFLTGLMVNLRFVIFSVIIAPHFTGLRFGQRAFWGYMTGDVSMIFFMRRFPSETPEIGKFEYMKGLFVANWTAWQIGSVAGLFLGSQIPENWGVGYAGTLAILCVLLPMVVSRATLIGVLVAGIVALSTFHWPYKLGMLSAVVIGMLCAMAWEEWKEKT